MNLKKKFGKVLMSKSIGTGPSSYKKIIYRAAVSQRLRNTALGNIHTNDRQSITRTRAKRKAGYFLVAHTVHTTPHDVRSNECSRSDHKFQLYIDMNLNKKVVV